MMICTPRAVMKVCLVAYLVFTVRSAHAVAVIDNLANTPSATALVGFDSVDSSVNLIGQAFRTGANGGTLNSISLPLEGDVNLPTVTVSVHPYSATSFPTAFGTTGAQTVGVFGTYTFVPTTTVTLAANTSYWIVARTNSGTAFWDYTLNQTFTGTGSFPAGTVAASSSNNGTSFDAVYSLSDGPQQFLVDINPVIIPESGSASLIFLAALAYVSGSVVCVRRNHARRTVGA